METTYIEIPCANADIVNSLFHRIISFVDRDGIADWATEPIRILSSVGLFQGTAQKKIEPKNAISIEQAIVLSYRGMLLVQDKTQK